MAKLAAKVYGDALFEEAADLGKLSDWKQEAQELCSVLQENPDLMDFLCHPQIEKEEKKSALENIFKGRLSDGLMGLLMTVLDKGRQKELSAILEYFIARVKEYEKIGIVTVTSALPLSQEQKKRVEARILETTAFETLETEYQTDPALIGGLTIRIGDRVADGSVRTRLHEIKQELMRKKVHA